jgi:D-serine deaminase-like pyridoxal phosphate-dependent protein
MLVSELDTPALTCDLDILESNIRKYQDMIEGAGLNVRPHIKTHKVPEIAHMQLAAGAIGICCQKVSEAEPFVAAGIRDVLIAYNVMGRRKLERLTRIARRADLKAAIDSAYTARGMSAQAVEDGAEIGILVELLMGRRSGVPTHQDAVELAKLVEELPGLRLRGLMGYPTGPWPECLDLFRATIKAFNYENLPLEIVSGGGTGSAWHAEAEKAVGFTEHRPGTYIYHDWGTASHLEGITIDDCAMRMICTVVSRATPDTATIDGGSKTFTNDGFRRGREEANHIVEYPAARTIGQNEEHGIVDVSNCERKPQLGERVTVIPHHACNTTNLHDEIAGVRDGRVEVIWAIPARGKIW